MTDDLIEELADAVDKNPSTDLVYATSVALAYKVGEVVAERRAARAEDEANKSREDAQRKSVIFWLRNIADDLESGHNPRNFMFTNDGYVVSFSSKHR